MFLVSICITCYAKKLGTNKDFRYCETNKNKLLLLLNKTITVKRLTIPEQLSKIVKNYVNSFI